MKEVNQSKNLRETLMKNNLVIYIPSVGRRVELIRLFYKAAKELNIHLTIIGSDNSELAPALYFVDYNYWIHSINSNDYENDLRQIINRHEVDLVIPTLDPELLKFSQISSKFKAQYSVEFIISNHLVIETFSSKYKTDAFASNHQILSPKKYSISEIKDYHFPLIVKPDRGSSSIGVKRLKKISDLKPYKVKPDNFIFQELIEGTEYTVDTYVDKNGKTISIVPRIRLETRSGEISKGQVIIDDSIIEETKRILNKLPFRGPITFQYIKDKFEKNYLIEINPRYGGGAPMSIMAGANTPKFVLMDYLNIPIKFDSEELNETKYSRYDSSVEVIGFD